MSLKYGKREIERVMAVLDADHETVEDASLACLREMEDIFKARAMFVVVGQLAGTKERTDVPPDDPEAIKVSLGWYSTEGEARTAGESLWFNTASGDRFRTWVLNVFHGSPAEFHGKRKLHYTALEEKQKEAKRERLRASIEKHEQNSRRAVWEVMSPEERARNEHLEPAA